MEKIKFGIQLTVLILAFPAWFLFEMKDADMAMKKNRFNEQVIELKDAEKETAGTVIELVPGSKPATVNI